MATEQKPRTAEINARLWAPALMIGRKSKKECAGWCISPYSNARASSPEPPTSTQHFGRFGLGASVMTIPANVSIEGIQLGKVNVAVFRKGDVGYDACSFIEYSEFLDSFLVPGCDSV